MTRARVKLVSFSMVVIGMASYTHAFELTQDEWNARSSPLVANSLSPTSLSTLSTFAGDMKTFSERPDRPIPVKTGKDPATAKGLVASNGKAKTNAGTTGSISQPNEKGEDSETGDRASTASVRRSNVSAKGSSTARGDGKESSEPKSSASSELDAKKSEKNWVTSRDERGDREASVNRNSESSPTQKKDSSGDFFGQNAPANTQRAFPWNIASSYGSPTANLSSADSTSSKKREEERPAGPKDDLFNDQLAKLKKISQSNLPANVEERERALERERKIQDAKYQDEQSLLKEVGAISALQPKFDVKEYEHVADFLMNQGSRIEELMQQKKIPSTFIETTKDLFNYFDDRYSDDDRRPVLDLFLERRNSGVGGTRDLETTEDQHRVHRRVRSETPF